MVPGRSTKSVLVQYIFDGPEYPYRLTLECYWGIGNAEAVQQCKRSTTVEANANTTELDLSVFDEMDMVAA